MELWPKACCAGLVVEMAVQVLEQTGSGRFAGPVDCFQKTAGALACSDDRKEGTRLPNALLCRWPRRGSCRSTRAWVLRCWGGSSEFGC